MGEVVHAACLASKNFRVTKESRGVLTVAMDVPGRTHNVFNEEVLAELQTLIDELEHDPTIRLVLFRSGKESGFLAGGDLPHALLPSEARKRPINWSSSAKSCWIGWSGCRCRRWP